MLEGPECLVQPRSAQGEILGDLNLDQPHTWSHAVLGYHVGQHARHPVSTRLCVDGMNGKPYHIAGQAVGADLKLGLSGCQPMDNSPSANTWRGLA